MELENEANYKFYKCRSLLACDSGGMVYDRSSRNYGENSLQYARHSQSEAGPTEKIIYIINTENQSKTNSRLPVDLTTHLDDDEFNDYEMKTNVIDEYKNKAVHYTQDVNKANYLDADKKNDVDESVYSLVDGILKNTDNDIIHHSQSSEILENENNIMIHNSQSSQILEHADNRRINHSQSSQNSNDSNLSYHESISDTSRIYNSSSEDTLSTQANLEYEFDPYKIEEVESYKNHMNKRKQIYNVKEDGYNELLDYNKSVQQNLVSNNNSKKKKLTNNKENQRKRLQSNLRKNPFANVKMSSILKGKSTIEKTKNFTKQQALEPITPAHEKNLASNSSCSYDDEVLLDLISTKSTYQYTDLNFSNSKDSVLQEQGTVAQLNSDLSNADYLDYVQPREQIIETDMDKLLTPIIENESSGIIKVPEPVNEIKKQVDCNGNEVDFQDIQKMTTLKSVLSPNQIAEREVFLHSQYAKKIGMENLFNTSNDAVISEIIFGTNSLLEQINLEFNYMRSVDKTHLKQNLMKNSFLKSVSCTLVESLNELHRFGGFIDDNSQEIKSSEEIGANIVAINNGFFNISDTSNLQKNKFQISLDKLNEKERNQVNSNLTFNFSNKSNLLGIDFQSRCNALEYLPNVKREIKRSSGPLVIKMKRINDENNEYVIDDSTKKTTKIVQKKTSAFLKSIERYECYDCAEKFRTKKFLISHVSEFHRGPYDSECDICHVKCRKSSGHKKHHQWCPKSIVHKCNTCDRIYCYRASLVKHLKTHLEVPKRHRKNRRTSVGLND